jgi:uncharacterized protein (TIGR02147 family)
MSLAGTGDYRQYLRERLEDRCQVNPRYSLRAFARDLKISSSRLSQVLQGKQGLSEQWAKKIAQRLGLSSPETEVFCTLVRASDARSKTQRRVAQIALETQQIRQEPSQTLQLDAFRVISDWYHFALLELTLLPSFKSEPAWIARKLGIARFEAEQAVERLKRLELLEDQRGRLVSSESHLFTGDGVPSDAIRKFNKQVLEKASRAIDLQTMEERDISTLTIAVAQSELPRFRELIKGFRKQMNHKSMEDAKKTSGNRPDEVYCLAVQFFRLTERE